KPVVTTVSHATREFGSFSSNASKIASLILSAILSGCPSVTDSDENDVFSTILIYSPLTIRLEGSGTDVTSYREFIKLIGYHNIVRLHMHYLLICIRYVIHSY